MLQSGHSAEHCGASNTNSAAMREALLRSNDASRPRFALRHGLPHQHTPPFWADLSPFLAYTAAKRIPGYVPVIAPAHTCRVLPTPRGGIMALGDVVHVSTIEISHPDAGMIYDLDKEQAVRSREAILRMAATDRFAIAGAHVNAPGFCYVTRKGASCFFGPASEDVFEA
jgi:hypothetical protein